ncbi:putative toxin-antitoxin system toxin component, PIN family [Desulfofundulus thermosubterraneus DSM 16057]|uniref:Putative toxin-antitoxin system toxin component, PIN family n=2 Tax=Desulfofundulus TaxID=2282741 RepID=A0A1M6HR36_9FIRM|nr:putative toxin-antitoxin system toxin component, PIN family [Desulfofundulus thermosubterraneus DSM 16057]
MRVMLDTNVLISGMVFSGPERRLLEVIREDHVLVVDDFLLAETREVLTRKFPGREQLINIMLQSFKVEKHPMPPTEKIWEAARYLRDPKDAAVLASVLLANPDIFVSGDKDLHTPDVRALTRVCTTRQALMLLEKG